MERFSCVSPWSVLSTAAAPGPRRPRRPPSAPRDYIRTEVAANLDFSYLVGPFAAQGFSSGSNGYQGLDPRNAGSWDRPNYAVYLDLQADVVPRLQLGTALRYKDLYSDFGTTLNGKPSALWRATDRVYLRPTVSSGFRAPTPGQANLRAVTTGFSGTGGLTGQGQVPPGHPIAAPPFRTADCS